jgi:AAA domain-containing protein
MNYQAVPAIRSEEPLLLGMIGPPGGGKTLSALRLAKGVQSVRGGDIIVIDTEGGRSRKYNDQIPFKIVEMAQDACSTTFLEAIRAQLPSKPAAIIVDSMSDEHERYLAWHDEMVPSMGGNEWAAWAKPKADRKKLLAGILKIKTPLIFTFRAREKTKQNPEAKNKQDKIVNIGWQPVAPLEIVHTLDLTCILPPRADGVPVWKSDKIGEDFIIKLPNYLAPYIEAGKPLCEEMGAAFARWAAGETISRRHGSEVAETAAPATSPGETEAGAADDPTALEYTTRWLGLINNASNAGHGAQMAKTWNDEKSVHKKIDWPDGAFADLKHKVKRAIESLKETT